MYISIAKNYDFANISDNQRALEHQAKQEFDALMQRLRKGDAPSFVMSPRNTPVLPMTEEVFA